MKGTQPLTCFGTCKDGNMRCVTCSDYVWCRLTTDRKEEQRDAKKTHNTSNRR